MLTNDIYSGRVKRENGFFLVQIFAKYHDLPLDRLPPQTIARIAENDTDGLVFVIEQIAGSYQSGFYSERGNRYDAPEAYHLWAERAKEGAGIILPKARLSRLYAGVPPDITGRNPYFRKIKKNETRWGNCIPIHPLNYSNGGYSLEMMLKIPDDLFTVCTNTESTSFLYGDHEAHKIDAFDKRATMGYIPTFFIRPNGELILERLKTCIPERPWRLVPSAGFRALILGKMMASL
jgi:hypothetical protein